MGGVDTGLGVGESSGEMVGGVNRLCGALHVASFEITACAHRISAEIEEEWEV